VVRRVVDALPEGSLLAIGNSLPIRDVDAFCPARRRDIRVCTQRGANGIDGLVSGAAGAALASGRPSVLLVGDVSFLHDLNGLDAARLTPLHVVVLNNGGGRIFDLLPIAGTSADLDWWTTPPNLDIRAAAAAFGLEHHRVTTLDQLDVALEPRPGSCVIEAVIDPRDPAEERRRLARHAAELVRAALEGLA
jgi:2-succinyl-5-enolpyruvyl-6-hydroxy-3-cyclohexene-1-carboxylate synthase